MWRDGRRVGHDGRIVGHDGRRVGHDGRRVGHDGRRVGQVILDETVTSLKSPDISIIYLVNSDQPVPQMHPCPTLSYT